MSDVITLVNIIPNLSSGETNQDSEPNLAVNPANPLEIAATAFTPSPNVGSKKSPVFFSADGGLTWSLKDLIAGTPVRDQTLRFATQSGILYAGVLWGTGSNIALINFDILRTSDFSGLTTMNKLAERKNDDQPFIQAATVPSGSGAGKDRIYVGSNDHAPANIPATIDLSLDAAIAAPVTATFVIEGRTVLRDGFPTRPAVHLNGTVYAIFYALIGATSDVVIVRDDNWASGGTPFTALTDTGDLKQGVRVATGVINPFNGLVLGQQRIGSDLSIAVDPRDSATVYICYGDQQGGTYTLYVRKSADSGATWSGNLRSIQNATNPALAVNSQGRLGFLYQQLTGVAPGQNWQTTLEFTTKTLLALDHVTPVATSIDPFVFTVTPGFGRVVTVIANAGNFGSTCPETFIDEELTIDNGGTGPLLITNITSSSPDFLTPSVLSYPIKLGVGDAIDIAIRFVPLSPGAKSATITIFSNDPAGPHKVVVSGLASTPRLSLIIAKRGDFGKVCVGRFADEDLILNNSSPCPVRVFAVASSDADFVVPEVLSFPLLIGPGDPLPLPIRFAPASFGAKSATITVTSSDPASPHTVRVHGDAPSGKLAVTGSLCFGGVKACCRAERTLSICNVGECALHVTSVAFKRKNPHWKLVNNPFPATLHPGSCLGVVVRYKATEKCPIASELVITSDDPTMPVRTLDVMAYTVWGDCGCKERGGGCGRKDCGRCGYEPSCDDGADDCCADGDEE